MPTVLRLEVTDETIRILHLSPDRSIEVVDRAWTPLLTQAQRAEVEWLFEYSHHTPWGPNRDRAKRARDELLTLGKRLWTDGLGLADDALGNVDAIEVVTSDEVALAHPWEVLTRPGSDRPLGGMGTVIVRRTSARSPADPDGPPTRVLLVVARPRDMFAPNLAGVATAMAHHLEKSTITVDLLMGASISDTRAALEQAQREDRPYHLVHLDVHGVSAPDHGQSVLVFEGADGLGEHVQLKQALRWIVEAGARSVVLSACRSIRPSTFGAVDGLAHVIGLSHELHPDAVHLFADGFYAALGNGATVPQASSLGRRRLAASGEDYGWAWPAIHHLVADGVTLLGGGPAPTPPSSKNSSLVRFDGETIRLLDGSLRAARPVNVFGPQGYGKSTVLRECRRWTDAFFTDVPSLWIEGASTSVPDIVDQVEQHLVSLPASSRSHRPLRSAVFIDDGDALGHDHEALTAVLDAGTRQVAIVMSRNSRLDVDAVEVKTPDAHLRRDRLIARGVPADVVDDLIIALAGTPHLVEMAERVDDPHFLLADPWSPPAAPPPSDLIPDELRRLAGVLNSALLVAALLEPRYPIAIAVNVLQFLRSDPSEGEDTSEDPGPVLAALTLNDDSPATLMNDLESVVEISFLRNAGLLTSRSDLSMWMHPLGLIAAVAAIDPDEVLKGSTRLDRLAKVYAASLVMDTVRDSAIHTRTDLAVSCLLYLTRRGFHLTAMSVMAAVASSSSIRRLVATPLGRSIRQALLVCCGGRPNYSDDAARSLWWNSFAFSTGAVDSAEFESEAKHVEADAAAGVEIPAEEFERIAVGRAAFAANTGRLDEAVRRYEEARRMATSSESAAHALRGLAMLAQDRGDHAAAMAYLSEIRSLPLQPPIGGLRLHGLDDLDLLEAATETDSGAAWESIARWDAAGDHPSAARHARQLSARAIEFHERGLASLRLGLLSEARRLLQEAIRLKVEIDDDSLLATSYLAMAGVDYQEGHLDAACEWLVSLSQLEDATPNQRLSGAIHALDLVFAGLPYESVEPIQVMTAAAVHRAIGEGRRADADPCLEWFARLHNARRIEAASPVLEDLADARFGDQVQTAIARSFVMSRAAVKEPIKVDAKVISILEGTSDRPGHFHVRTALSNCLTLRALGVHTRRQRGEAVDESERLTASTDALRAARIYADLEREGGTTGLLPMALALATDLAYQRSLPEWWEIAKIIEELPRTDRYWTDFTQHTVRHLITMGLEGDEPSTTILQRLAAMAGVGAAPVGLSVAISSGISALLQGENGPPTRDARVFVAPVTTMVSNGDADDEAWMQTTGCLLDLSYALATGGHRTELRALADVAMAALAERGVWERGERIASCLLYDALSALADDVPHAAGRLVELQQMLRNGCGPAWVFLQSLAAQGASALVEEGWATTAIEALRAVSASAPPTWSDETAAEHLQAVQRVVMGLPASQRPALVADLMLLLTETSLKVGTEKLKDETARLAWLAGMRAFAASGTSDMIDRATELVDQRTDVSPSIRGLAEGANVVRSIVDTTSSLDRWSGERVHGLPYLPRMALRLLIADLGHHTTPTSVVAVRQLVIDLRVAFSS